MPIKIEPNTVEQNKDEPKAQKATKTKKHRSGARKALIAAFAAVALAGGGARVYSDHQASTTLSADYARAAACTQLQNQHKVCTAQELGSVSKIKSNDDIKNLGNDAMAGVFVAAILAL